MTKDWTHEDNAAEKAQGARRRERERVVNDYVIGAVMRDYLCPGTTRKVPGAYSLRMRERLTPEENAIIQSMTVDDVQITEDRLVWKGTVS